MALRSYMYGDPSNLVDAVRRDEERNRKADCGTCGAQIEAWNLTGCELGLKQKNGHCYQWRAKRGNS
jgi:hypothetical protein